MKNILLIASLAAVVPIAACSTVPSGSVSYERAAVPTETKTDAFEGLHPNQQDEYPTLYYNSPGLRRLNREQ